MTVASASLLVRVRTLLFFVGWFMLAGLALRGADAETVEPASLIAPELPGWVKPLLALPPPPPVSTTTSTRTLVYEQQIDVQRQATFVHYALRVESESGLQGAGQVALSFSKVYETLQWHFLRVWRDGVKREILAPAAVQVLRQEEDADRFMYHGRLSALAVLRDVRVGDIIEYAYTRTGANPVFGGRYSAAYPGALSVPVDRLSYRVIAAPARLLHVAELGDFKLAHRVGTVDGRVEHAWTAENLAPIRPESDAPESEIQYPFVQVTEFASWREVADWGRELFAVPIALGPELLARVAEVTKGLASDEARANAVVRFVQDEMRYLAVHIGESTHRPYAPDEVFQRRFGDCKDKSLLLVALLRHLGFEAHVALVDTQWNRTLRELQPSPLAFDHAIVHVRLPERLRPTGRRVVGGGARAESNGGQNLLVFDAKLPPPRPADPFNPSEPGLSPTELMTPPPETRSENLWLDATSTLQGGSLFGHHRGNFGYALILRPDAVELTRMEPWTQPGNVVHVHEAYVATKFDGPAQLEVTTTYRGGMADFYRYYRRQSDPTQMAQQLTGTLGRLYPGVKSLGPLVWSDDREQNVVVARTSFEVPDFWTLPAEGKLRVLEVYPWAISERLPRPESTERSRPFALSYPTNVLHEIDVTLPKDWPAATDGEEVKDDTFHFQWKSETKRDQWHILYEWHTDADAVPAARMAAWSKKMSEVRAALGHRLTHNIRLSAELKETGPVWPLLGTLIAGVLAGAGLGLWLYHRRRNVPAEPPLLAPPPLEHHELVGIGGWLVLVAIHTVLRPLLLLVAFWPTFKLVANRASWIALTDGESGSYLPGYSAVAFGEMLVAGFLVAWSLVLLVQFFRRRSSLPLAYISYLVTFAAWTMAHLLWMRSVPGLAGSSHDLEGVADVIRVVAFTAVWIPYFVKSRRVKLTFTRS